MVRKVGWFPHYSAIDWLDLLATLAAAGHASENLCSVVLLERRDQPEISHRIAIGYPRFLALRAPFTKNIPSLLRHQSHPWQSTGTRLAAPSPFESWEGY